jgi:hypothetical protein
LKSPKNLPPSIAFLGQGKRRKLRKSAGIKFGIVDFTGLASHQFLRGFSSINSTRLSITALKTSPENLIPTDSTSRLIDPARTVPPWSRYGR